jgi:predicted aminopeptidase
MQFGDALGFPKTKSYSKYIELNRSVFLYSLSASKKDRFEDYVWHWPIIGSLPYKGFINENDAKTEELTLKSDEYDTYIGQSSAISTLGLLSDPIITTMINKTNPLILINTIFHERTHQLFFKKGHVVFNENSAVLLGSLATLDFVKSKYGTDSVEFRAQNDKIHDLILYSKFLDEFYNELDSVYLSQIPPEEKLAKRTIIFGNYLEEFAQINPQLKSSFKNFDKKEINNAYIVSQYRYYGKFHAYYKVFEKLGNTNKTIEFFKQAAESDEPEQTIKNFLEP